MAEIIKDKLYQVAISNKWDYIFIHAKDDEDLIRFLAENYPDKTELYGASEFRKDGTSRTVKLISHPLFDELYAQKEKESPQLLPAGVVIINNKPWAVTLPTGGNSKNSSCQWNDFISATSGKTNLIHCLNMVSWCQDKAPDLEDFYVQRGYATTDIWQSYGHLADRAANIGYRPVLIPLDPDTLEPRPSVFMGRQDGDCFRMGSLYMDGTALSNPKNAVPEGDIPDYVPGTNLQIGESSENPNEWITWIKVGDVLIADRNLIKNISWEDLDSMDLARGPANLQHEKKAVDKLIASAQKKACQINSYLGREVDNMQR